MSDGWTIRRVLDWTTKDFAARGLDSPRLDAELLVGNVLGIGRVQIYLDLDRPLATEELASIRELVGRRRKREPVAQILGRRDFHGRTFEVSKDVLTPRPDTEILVERALTHLPSGEARRVLDLCTGTGCIGISLALARPDVTVVLTDASERALGIARRNVEALGVASRVSTELGDLFAAVSDDAKFDCIVSNPPYIPSADIDGLAPEVSEHEPRLALDGGLDGLDFYRRLAREAPARLAGDGIVLVEVGVGQAHAVASLFEEAGAVETKVSTDYGGIERVVEGRFVGGR